MKDKKNIFSFGVIIVAILFVTGLSFASSFKRAAKNIGVQIASAEGKEDESDDEDKDEEGKDEDKEDESAKNEEEKQRELEKKEAEKNREAQKKLSENEDDDEDEIDEDEINDTEDKADDDIDDEDKADDEADDDGEESVTQESVTQESVTQETVTNEDGTTTQTIMKTEGDEVKTIIIKRDQDGNIIERTVTEAEKGKVETKTTTFDVYGKKLSELEMKTLDGKVVKVEVKEGSQKVKYETNEDALVIDDDDDEDEEFEEEGDEVKIKVEGNAFGLKKKEAEIKINFPMEVDGETGQVYVVTPNGKIELKTMPDVIVEKARSAGIDDVSKLELKVEGNKLKYEVEGTRTEKFLGLVKIKIKAAYQYDQEDGNLSDEVQSFWQSILDALSF